MATFIYLFVLFTLANIAWIARDNNDDFTIARMISGTIAEPRGLSLFINAALSQIIYPISAAVPSLNWYVIIESTMAFAALFTLIYLVLTHTNSRLAFLLIAMLTVLSIPGCTFIVNFTVIAFVNVCAGFTLITLSFASEKHKPSYLVGGAVFMVIGSLWRFEMLELAVPFFGLALLALFVKKIKTPRSGDAEKENHVETETASRLKPIGRQIARLVPLGAALALCFGLLAYDQAVWQKSPWNEWMEFNDIRSLLSDYPHRPYEEVKEELREIGVSENDYLLLFNWISEDPEFFTSERMQAIADIALVSPLANSNPVFTAARYARNTILDTRLAPMLIGAVLYVVFLLRGKRRALGIALLALSLAAALAFFFLGRLPTRVHYPTWLFGLFALFTCVPKDYGPSKANAHAESSSRPARSLRGVVSIAMPALTCLAIGIILGFSLPRLSYERIEAVIAADSFDPHNGLATYMEQHPERIFTSDTEALRELRYSHVMRAPYSPFINSRLVYIGGWDARSPSALTNNAEIGMSNPLKNLADNENAYYLSRSKDIPIEILTYIREHHYPEAHCSLVETLKGDDMIAPVYIFSFTTS